MVKKLLVEYIWASLLRRQNYSLVLRYARQTCGRSLIYRTQIGRLRCKSDGRVGIVVFLFLYHVPYSPVQMRTSFLCGLTHVDERQ